MHPLKKSGTKFWVHLMLAVIVVYVEVLHRNMLHLFFNENNDVFII